MLRGGGGALRFIKNAALGAIGAKLAPKPQVINFAQTLK